ncbi:hypothetical protein [Aureimonas leprariae]|uniref:Uncharacterized protein n=1 Tax=Plantimonas leprariae TaxID=2615207 RepID=A0A7V7PSF8_9HYPH|nr:hypothetical protein [Aureimonas leprariae]KAB0682021.1 hypothetical protein F6X38_04240 [Aureimonas leprariae]
MNIATVEGCTRVIGESQGYIGLPLRDELINCAVDGPAVSAMVSAWQPMPEEIARIMSGEPIHLRVLGTAHPPVMLFVGSSE